MSAPRPFKPLLSVLRGERQARVPFWYMRQAGRYLPEYRAIRNKAKSFLELCYTPELAVEISLQPLRRFGMDGIILFSDILVVPDALGVGVRFSEGEGPKLEPTSCVDAVPTYDRRRAEKTLSPVLETLRGIKQSAPEDATLLGFAGAPWTVATYMVEGGTSKDFATVKAWAYADPDSFQTLIDVLIDATADYLLTQIEAGADAVQLFDSWAGVLTPSALERWSIAPARAICDRLKAVHPEVPVIGFPRGVGVNYVRFARETGVDAVSLDTTVQPAWAAQELDSSCVFQGNLDPIMLVVGGRAMLDEAGRILDALSGRSHVFNLGHGIVPHTPPEHVAELSEFVRSWRA